MQLLVYYLGLLHVQAHRSLLTVLKMLPNWHEQLAKQTFLLAPKLGEFSHMEFYNYFYLLEVLPFSVVQLLVALMALVLVYLISFLIQLIDWLSWKPTQHQLSSPLSFDDHTQLKLSI